METRNNQPTANYKRILLDIMTEGRFYKQLKMMWDSVLPPSKLDIEKFVMKMLPSMEYREHEVIVSNQSV